MTDARLKRSLRATLVGLVINALLTCAKFTAGILGHSHALIADAVESLADIFSSIVVWRGVVVAAAPADEDHPYGHGKAEPIAAATVSTMLLVADRTSTPGAGAVHAARAVARDLHQRRPLSIRFA
jgi:cation diffusion facilitator family transporter